MSTKPILVQLNWFLLLIIHGRLKHSLVQVSSCKMVLQLTWSHLFVPPDTESPMKWIARHDCGWCWQKLHSHTYTRATVCSFVSFTHYLIYLRRRIVKKIRLWRCLLHRSSPSHSW
jgi:hypothetical protein